MIFYIWQRGMALTGFLIVVAMHTRMLDVHSYKTESGANTQGNNNFFVTVVTF